MPAVPSALRAVFSELSDARRCGDSAGGGRRFASGRGTLWHPLPADLWRRAKCAALFSRPFRRHICRIHTGAAKTSYALLISLFLCFREKEKDRLALLSYSLFATPRKTSSAPRIFPRFRDYDSGRLILSNFAFQVITVQQSIFCTYFALLFIKLRKIALFSLFK